jgi:hypothetical protein
MVPGRLGRPNRRLQFLVPLLEDQEIRRPRCVRPTNRGLCVAKIGGFFLPVLHVLRLLFLRFLALPHLFFLRILLNTQSFLTILMVLLAIPIHLFFFAAIHLTIRL